MKRNLWLLQRKSGERIVTGYNVATLVRLVREEYWKLRAKTIVVKKSNKEYELRTFLRGELIAIHYLKLIERK